MASALTAQQVLDRARTRHPLFALTDLPDGVVLQAIDARQRTLLLEYSGAVDGLVNTTVDLATTFSGILLGQSDGVPVYGTTYADGWPLHQTDDGVPYVNFSEPAIAGDPFGVNGGTPGFPLPSDYLSLVQVSATTSGHRTVPVVVVAETARLDRQRAGFPTAFLSGNRLVPLRAFASGLSTNATNASNANDVWSSVTSLQLSYVALPVLEALTDRMTLPAALHEALIAGVAEMLGYATTALSPADKAAMSAQARRAEQSAADFSLNVVGTASSGGVVFR